MIKYYLLGFIIILYTCIHGYLNYTAQQNASEFYNDRINKEKTNPKVYDIMHKY